MTNNLVFWGVYIIFFGALIYFMAYKPQKKQREAYDLQGRRVSTPKNGLYIINGKKVFVK